MLGSTYNSSKVRAADGAFYPKIYRTIYSHFFSLFFKVQTNDSSSFIVHHSSLHERLTIQQLDYSPKFHHSYLSASIGSKAAALTAG
ncbi:hypothetical protein SAMN05661044_00555 [Olivibacter domesticus]|uniref:Uncharacterized protein n=1 Tax=Olivibacter domesticus TaxID=407022 RepID=A0A1H7I3H8_OLID1|nr:hypothetical protein SAMN05661044_00555 [Olivibacter domesticus]